VQGDLFDILILGRDFQHFNATEFFAMPRDAGKCQHWRQVFQLNPGATNGCFGWEVVDLEPRTARIDMDCVSGSK